MLPTRALGVALAALVFLAPAAAITIGGVNYLPGGIPENLNVPFTAPNGIATSGVYSAYVLLKVSGTGFSHFADTNDAFYTYPVSPSDGVNYYQLAIDTAPLPGGAGDPPRDARNFIVFDVDSALEILGRPYTPAFRSDHTYDFVIDTTLLPAGNLPGKLYLGVSDGAFNDNGGAFSIAVTQLTTGPEPASGFLLIAGLTLIVAPKLPRPRNKPDGPDGRLQE